MGKKYSNTVNSIEIMRSRKVKQKGEVERASFQTLSLELRFTCKEVYKWILSICGILGTLHAMSHLMLTTDEKMLFSLFYR